MSTPQNDHVWECSCDECRDWLIATAKAAGVAEERAAIVKRIRVLAKVAHGLVRFDGQSLRVAVALEGLAAEIERGDHITKESNDE